MIGGFTQHPAMADDFINGLLQNHVQDIADKLKRPIDSCTAISYKTQMVTGMNYKIKALVDGQEYIHVIIYVYTQDDSHVSKVLTVVTNQTKDSDM